jgi:hypothetical protein
MSTFRHRLYLQVAYLPILSHFPNLAESSAVSHDAIFWMLGKYLMRPPVRVTFIKVQIIEFPLTPKKACGEAEVVSPAVEIVS